MTSDLVAVHVDARDPHALARFWAGLLAAPPPSYDATTGIAEVAPPEAAGWRLRFVPSDAAKRGPNRVHLDLTSSSLTDQEEQVARALALGGRHLDVGQGPEDDHVVLADPEGNELCVIGPENRFLAGCGPVGCINGEGSAAVGRFWSAVLGWPLVWDQDGETAIQAAAGGTKMAWGGRPCRHRTAGPAGGSRSHPGRARRRPRPTGSSPSARCAWGRRTSTPTAPSSR